MAKKKTLKEIVIMPLVPTLIGTGSTYFITQYQQKHTEQVSLAQRGAAATLARAQIESAEKLSRDQHAIKVLEIFGEKIVDGDAEVRKRAVRLLPAVGSEVGRKLAEAIEKFDSDEGVKQAAKRVKEEALAKEIRGLIEAFSGPLRRSASSKLRTLYEQGDEGKKRDSDQFD